MAKTLHVRLTLAAIGLFSRPAFADTVTVSGLPLAVDEIAAVDSSNVKVTLFGASQIVPKDRLEDYLVDEYFGDVSRAAVFSDRILQDFVSDNLRQKKLGRGAIAFRALCARSSMNDDAWREFIEGLQTTAALGDLLKMVVEQGYSGACPSAANARFIYSAGMGDTAWVRGKAVRLAVQSESALRPLIRERIKQSGLSRNFSQMSLQIDLFGAAFGIDDVEYNELKRMYQKVIEAIDDIKAGDLERVYTLMELSRSDKWLSDVISPLLVEALHEQAGKLIKRGDREQALLVLSHIDLKRRTPTSHELTRRILNELQPGSKPVILDPLVSSFVRSVAFADASVRAAFLQYLDRICIFYLQNGRLEDMRPVFNMTLVMRPDPSPENDQLRVGLIRAMAKRGLNRAAGQTLQEIRTPIAWADRARFFVAGLYFDVRYIYVAILAPLLAGIILAFIEVVRRYQSKLRQGLEKLKEESKRFAHSEEEENFRPQFVSSGLIRSMSPSMVEYRECLAIFGLTIDADLKTIKTAYRNAVKEVHPDHLGTAQDPRAAEKFISLTKTYERLLELRDAVHELELLKRE